MNAYIDKIKKEFPFADYLDNYNKFEPYVTIEKTLVKYLSEGDKVLDFGSGPCDKTAVAKLLGFNCTAVDDLQDDWYKQSNNTQKILDFANSIGINFSFDLSEALNDQYELVMMNDVLEHLHDSPRDILNDLIGSIKPHGYLFITVPNITNIRKRLDVLRGRTNLPRYDLFYWYPGPWRGPVREYTRGDLEKMTKYLNMELVELTTVNHMLHNLSPKLIPFYKVFIKLFPDLADTWLLVIKKPECWEPNKEINHSKFMEIYQQKNSNVYSEKG